MDRELNAVGYDYNETNYINEFQSVLNGIFVCYTMMLNDNIEVPNDENEIRNTLLIKYLKNDEKREITGLSGKFIFDREVPEDNSAGRTDIKIQTINTLKKTDAYYIIECKRLDNKNTTGISGLNAEYIKNGIYRFVTKHYSTYHRVNAMLGFVVEKMDINKNIDNINSLLQKHFTNCKTTRFIEKESFISNFEFHYSSEHNDCDGDVFTLYHLMFDFSDNIKIN
jgi:hypothetical protein